MLFERLMKLLREQKASFENALLTNGVNDFNEYKYLTGRIRGLQDALELLRETFNRGNDNDSNE